MLRAMLACEPLHATTAADVEGWLSSAAGRAVIAVDTETTGRDVVADELLIVQVAAGEDLPVLCVDTERVDPRILGGLLGDPGVTTAFHHAPFDLAFLARAGVPVAGAVDTLMAQRLLDGAGRARAARSLAALAGFRLGVTLDKSVRTTFGADTGPLTDAQLRYAAMDAAATLAIWHQQSDELALRGLSAIAAEQFALAPHLAGMTVRGVGVDVAALARLAGEAAARMSDAGDAVQSAIPPGDRPHDLFGPVPVDLDDQRALTVALTDAGVTTTGTHDGDLFAVGHHPVVAALLRWRHLRRLVQRAPSLAAAVGDEGRLHLGWGARGPERALASEPDLVRLVRDPALLGVLRAAPGAQLVAVRAVPIDTDPQTPLSWDPPAPVAVQRAVVASAEALAGAGGTGVGRTGLVVVGEDLVVAQVDHDGADVALAALTSNLRTALGAAWQLAALTVG